MTMKVIKNDEVLIQEGIPNIILTMFSVITIEGDCHRDHREGIHQEEDWETTKNNGVLDMLNDAIPGVMRMIILVITVEGDYHEDHRKGSCKQKERR